MNIYGFQNSTYLYFLWNATEFNLSIDATVMDILMNAQNYSHELLLLMLL
jgi:hypothetical protein